MSHHALSFPTPLHSSDFAFSLSLNFLQYYTERLSDFLPLRQVVLGWILPSLYQLCLTEGLKDTKVTLEYTVTFS